MSDLKPTSFGILVFPTFQALDAFGPLDALNTLSRQIPLNLSVISATLDPVSTKPASNLPGSADLANSNFGETIVPTHDFTTAPPLDVLIIPGGYGVRAESIQPYIDFVRKVYPSLKYIFTICTGSWIAARAGILDGKRATSNKANWADTIKLGDGKVDWVSHARWVVDGNVYTTSGVAAGIDGIFAFIQSVYGKEFADRVANSLEYDRHTDSSWDPWAELHGL